MPEHRVELVLRDDEFHPQMDARFLRAIAIVRIELGTFGITTENADWRVKVQKIVFDIAEARTEAERLNRENADKGCWYFSQVTRIRIPGSNEPAQ